MTTLEFTKPSIATCDLLVNGARIDELLRGQIMGICVDDDLHLPSMVAIELVGLADGHEAIAEQIAWLDDDAHFAVGDTVEIQLGSLDQLTTVLVAELTGLEPEFTLQRQPRLCLRGHDRRHRLMRGRKTRTFVDQKDSDIATLIAQDAQLTAQVEDSGVTHAYLAQVNQTDLAFLQSRANAIGYELRVDDQDLIFRPLGYGDSAIATLNFHNGLLEFHPRLTTLGQTSTVQVTSWNPVNKATWIGQSQVGDEGSTMQGNEAGGSFSEAAFDAAVYPTVRYGLMTQAEADQVAQAQLQKQALSFIRGEGICRGQPAIRAGSVIAIEGVGARFSGDYYVTSASHRYQPQGYYTHFEVRRNAI